MLSFEDNLEDIRRIFKEADIDHSGYLNKQELQDSLLKLGIDLDNNQIEDLMLELDADGN